MPELVHLEDPADGLDRGVGDRGQMQDRGVVDEDVDVTGRPSTSACPVVLLRHVAVHVARRIAELGRRLLAPFVEDVGEHDGRPLADEPLPRSRRPIRARRSGDNR